MKNILILQKMTMQKIMMKSTLKIMLLIINAINNITKENNILLAKQDLAEDKYLIPLDY